VTVFPEAEAGSIEALPAEEVVRWTYRRFHKVALVASFQAESSVLIDIASSVADRVEVITLDTGRIPEETFQVMERLRLRYGFHLNLVAPDPDEVAAMVAERGPNLFKESVELRVRCCDVRKKRPLERALQGYDAWLTGLRRDQSVTRAATPVVAEDRERPGVAKVAPLASWSRNQVWEHIERNHIPTNELYRQGYASIGCAPCTRAVQPGEDERAGRWWWEQEGVKECGLHRAPATREVTG
jgi:phosphoadenosine phosphosulfate reductase